MNSYSCLNIITGNKNKYLYEHISTKDALKFIKEYEINRNCKLGEERSCKIGSLVNN